ncbi:MAG: hypothetical protein KJ927_18760 [Candidatus Eisenbacteria bacterium]|nr:hypothetical protein [Candidatus Eisenbacteria bacterium]
MNSRRENHVEIIANRLVEQKIDLKPISWGIAEADVLKPPEQIIPFSLAADSPEKGKNYFPTDSPVLSLASEDGSYLVRIFPKASGQGAVAVLIRGEVGSDSSQT